MSRTEILQHLVELAREVFDEEDLDFRADTRFEDLDAWDSMNHVRMVVAMERRFEVRFGVGELQRVERVSDLLDLIEAHRAS
jgi:acyl carrier protein